MIYEMIWIIEVALQIENRLFLHREYDRHVIFFKFNEARRSSVKGFNDKKIHRNNWNDLYETICFVQRKEIQARNFISRKKKQFVCGRCNYWVGN